MAPICSGDLCRPHSRTEYLLGRAYLVASRRIRYWRNFVLAILVVSSQAVVSGRTDYILFVGFRILCWIGRPTRDRFPIETAGECACHSPGRKSAVVSFYAVARSRPRDLSTVSISPNH